MDGGTVRVQGSLGTGHAPTAPGAPAPHRDGRLVSCCGARHAARIADSAPTTNPELIDAYQRAAAARKGPGPHAHSADGKTQMIVGVADDPDAVWHAVGPNCLHEINEYAAWLRRGFGDRQATAFGDNPPYFEAADVHELRDSGRYLVLTPKECIDWARSHDGRLRLAPLVGGIEPAQAWQMLRTIEDEVLPDLLGGSDHPTAMGTT